MHANHHNMHKLTEACVTMRVLLAGLLCLLLATGCDKAVTRSHSTRTINGRTTITAKADGVTRTLYSPGTFSIGAGRITALAPGGVMNLQESGSPAAREAEVREKDGAWELWIKEGSAFRRATAADDRWLEGFLQALGGGSAITIKGNSVVLAEDEVTADPPKRGAPKEDLDDANLPVPAVLAKLKRRSFSHERQKGIEELIAKRTLEPPDQVAVVEAVFDQLDFGHEQVSVLKKLIRRPGFSPEARKAVIRRIDRLSFDHEKVEVQKALLELK